MQWNVLLHDVNAGKITTWDIFRHCGFAKDVEKLLSADLDKEHFAELLQKRLQYYFWSKCEYEVVVTSWPTYIDGKELGRLNKEYKEYNEKLGKYPYKIDVAPDVGKKIDVYDQVMLNFDAFVEYVLNFNGYCNGEDL
jgi:hypothetical protein